MVSHPLDETFVVCILFFQLSYFVLKTLCQGDQSVVGLFEFEILIFELFVGGGTLRSFG